MVGLRQSLRVLGDRAVADDLHDQVGGPFDLHVAAQLAAGLGDQPRPAGGQRLVREKHDVRLGRGVGFHGTDPGAVAHQVTEIALLHKPVQHRGDLHLQRTVAKEILGRHVHLDSSGDVIDSASFREIVRKGPAPEVRQRPQIQRDLDLSFKHNRRCHRRTSFQAGAAEITVLPSPRSHLTPYCRSATSTEQCCCRGVSSAGGHCGVAAPPVPAVPRAGDGRRVPPGPKKADAGVYQCEEGDYTPGFSGTARGSRPAGCLGKRKEMRHVVRSGTKRPCRE